MSLYCPHCQTKNREHFTKDGNYFRKDDSKTIQRYRCKRCKKRFSLATFSSAIYQKKRRYNFTILKLYCSGVSLRRIALILNLNKNTIPNKVVFLSQLAKAENQKFLQKLQFCKVSHLQFDDLITSEHTKCKPLSVSTATDAKRRFILGVKVSQIPAFGHLAKFSQNKYGRRKSHHKQGLKDLFEQIKESVEPSALIRSDEHHNYPEFTKNYFPKAIHERFKGGRGSVAGQGELKKLRYDPLFAINHTCAILRANINRLIRKTWCTTKDPIMLQNHLELFMYFHNTYLIKSKI